jgi:hypothetical protein
MLGDNITNKKKTKTLSCHTNIQRDDARTAKC